jgi:glutaredoxin 3
MKVEIYSKDACGYCNAAKTLFESKGIQYQEHRIGYNGVTRETLLEKVPTARTVPQIFINDELIGGYTELSNWFKTYA